MKALAIAKEDMKKKEGPDNRDRLLGLRLKTYRDMKGLSQTDLGEKLGVTYQQVQKYEHGKNKISVSRLVDICKILDIPLTSFLHGLYNAENASVIAVSDRQQDRLISNPDYESEVKELLKIYFSIESATDRQEIINVIKALAATKKKSS